MCKKKTKPTGLGSNAGKDVISFKQELRAILWQMIASNNEEVLTDPNARPLENSMPYVEQQTPAQTSAPASKEKKEDDVKSLDEIMPLPEKKKKKASELARSSSEDKQINIDEAIAASPENGVKPQSQEQPETSDAKPKAEEHIKEASTQTSATSDAKPKAEEQSKKTLAEVFQDYFDWRRARLERKDYFKALELQIKNKNAACYELLNLLEDE